MGVAGEVGGENEVIHCTQTNMHKFTLIKYIMKIKIHEVEGRNKRRILETILIA